MIYQKNEHGDWQVQHGESYEDEYLDRQHGKNRYTFTKLVAAKAFAQDWAFFEIDKSHPDPTNYNTDDDKYLDLDVFATKSKYFKAGMFVV